MCPLVAIKWVIHKGKTSKCMMFMGYHFAWKIPMPILCSTKGTNIGNNLNLQWEPYSCHNVMVQT